MPIDKTWVVAESSGGSPTSLTLELLTKARSLGSAVEAVAWGPDVAATAGDLGSYGASKVYDVGDLGDALPASRVAAAIAAQVEAGNGPDLILIGTTYDGRDVAGRLSMPAGSRMRTRWARRARRSSPPSTSPAASRGPPSTWSA
jgi:electron transfer flavoprotein alpha subunit